MHGMEAYLLVPVLGRRQQSGNSPRFDESGRCVVAGEKEYHQAIQEIPFCETVVSFESLFQSTESLFKGIAVFHRLLMASPAGTLMVPRERLIYRHASRVRSYRVDPMKIGILGDTHDHLPNIQRVVERLEHENLELCLHTGDFIAPFVIPVLAGMGVRMVGVFGNNDGDRELLISRCRDVGGIEIRGNFAELEEAGVRIALLHGHEKTLLADLIESQLFDLVVHGHTH